MRGLLDTLIVAPFMAVTVLAFAVAIRRATRACSPSSGLPRASWR